MASGIVSVAAQEQLRDLLSAVLATVAAAAWIGLIILSGARLILAADLIGDDLASPAKGLDFFTFVAAAEVLGVRAVVAGQDRIGTALWTTGALAWLALALALPVAIHRRRLTPAWWAASGNWLLPVVATQSLAVLAVALAGPGRVRPLLLVALSCWVIGLVMYAALIAAIGARVLCVNAQPARFTPDDWIVMGALAISALAATALLQADPADRMLWPAHALLADAAVVAWGLASSAVAPLAVLHLRGLLRDRSARRYQTRWWAGVFPLGMYSVATRQVAVTVGLQPLELVARIAFWVAVGAWSLTAAAAAASRSWPVHAPRRLDREV
jgi:tellurite resistance protein TehA-like permease